MAGIRVLTFNICGLPWFRPSLAERAAQFCRRIDTSDLDVAMFQEVWSPRTVELLRAGLPSFPYVAVAGGAGRRPAGGVATFSRLPLRRVWFRSYRGLVPSAGGLAFRLSGAVNSLLKGVLLVELSGRDIVLGNTHLTANKDGDWSVGNRYNDLHRRQLTRLQAAVASRIPALTIVGGDFNLASSGALYHRILDDGAWRDPFAATDPTTFHAAFLRPDHSPHRIDYILIRGDADRFPVLDAQPWFTEPVSLDGAGPRYVSDHVALTVHIGLPG